jgi:hypothetical protein
MYYEESKMTGEIAGGFFGMFLGIIAVLVCLALVMYVLAAVGLYRIANARSHNLAILAWVPVGNMWLMGDLCGSFKFGEKVLNNGGAYMLGLSLAQIACGFIPLIGGIVSLVCMIAVIILIGKFLNIWHESPLCYILAIFSFFGLFLTGLRLKKGIYEPYPND